MTREHKLALIIGFSLVLVVGVLISDHFSKAHEARVRTELAETPARNLTMDGLRPVGAAPTNTGGSIFGPASASGATQVASNPPVVLPAVHDPMASAGNGQGGGGRDSGITMGNRYSAQPQSDRIALDLGRGDGMGSSGTLMSESTRPIEPDGLSGGSLTQPLPTPSNSTGTLGGPGEVRPVGPNGQSPGMTIPGGTGTMGGGTVTPPPTVAPAAPKEDVINGVPVRLCSRYDVKEGDSMYRIAKEKYGDASLWNKLAEFNKGKVNDKGSMRHGVTILCPPKEALLGKPLPTSAPDSVTTPTGRPAPQMVDPASTKPPTRLEKKDSNSKNTEKAIAAGSGPRSYTVVKGDVLSDVARKTLGSSKRWMEIHDLNKDVLDDEDSLVVGMTLKIPAR